MNTCKFCGEDVEDLIDTCTGFSLNCNFLVPGIQVWVENGYLNIIAVADTYEPNFQDENVPIKFCPMCGREF